MIGVIGVLGMYLVKLSKGKVMFVVMVRVDFDNNVIKENRWDVLFCWLLVLI